MFARASAVLCTFAVLVTACQKTPPPATADDIAKAQGAITAPDLLAHIRDLSDDSMLGRGPGTLGEDRAIKYIAAQFQAIGLQPGNPNGSWMQNVDLLGFTAVPTASFQVGNKQIALANRTDFVAATRREAAEVDVDTSDMVFVGYGVVAPEYNWDDYKGVDVQGKTIVMLVNDPAVPDPRDPTQLDSTVFRGKAMTYYGRWTYKYEIASDQGCGCGHHCSPDRARGLSLGGRPAQLVAREHWMCASPTGTRRASAVEGVDHARQGEGALQGGRQGFRRAGQRRALT